MAFSNAEKQARWRARRAAELRALRDQAPRPQQAQQPQSVSAGHLIEMLIKQLVGRPRAERARAIAHLSRRLGLELERADTSSSDVIERHGAVSPAHKPVQ